METTIAITTTLIAIIALYIAYRQFRNDQLMIKNAQLDTKISLFDRRFDFYTKYRKLLITCLQGIDDKNRHDVYRDLGEIHRISVFLFSEEFAKKIEANKDKIINISKAYIKVHGPAALPVGEKRIEKVDELYDTLTEIDGELASLEQTFSEFMKLTV